MTLEVKRVSKTYPNGVRAVKDLSMTLTPGEVFGIVGPNGAGKSTLLQVMSGLLKAESGSILYDGRDISGTPHKAAEFVGLMPDPLGVYTDITAHDYLEFFARVLAIPGEERAARIAAVVDELELEPWLTEEVETLSSGWQRRLALGRILLANVPVLLLDEPAAGLDVAARKELLEIVRKLARGNRAIMISSHILPELEDLADRFGIIDAGEWKPVRNGEVFFSRKDLVAGTGSAEVRIRCSDAGRAREIAQSHGHNAEVVEDNLHVRTRAGDDESAAIIALLCSQGIAIYEVDRLNSGLSDVVLNVLDTRQEDNA
jgi:ABC-type multidrug transport system ATPase subunit